ncbi:MAG: hypothetical protein HZB38_05430 [Planctomycetes bacterium]|nr:hypothetical protein [Planctomycetota bacterium]
MNTASTTVPPFPLHATTAVRALRAAFSQLLESLGGDPYQPQQISRTFGLNKNLAWKISKVIQSDDSGTALRQMPGPAGIKIFLNSMERAGADRNLLEAARGAVREYEHLIETHSGDRATLEMMGSELSSAGRRERDLYHRKLLFQGASYVWGVQARVILKVGVVGPGSRVGLLDIASLSALIDFRRLRPDVSWELATRRARNDDGSPMFPPEPEPIDPRFAGDDRPPLMADFCSQPLPELSRHSDATGIRFELPEGPVGKTGALTCVAGTIQRGLPYFRAPDNEWGEHSALCNTPASILIVDLFFHEKFTFAIPPRVELYSELCAAAPYPSRGRDRNRLPLNERLQNLGKGPLPVATPEVKTYSEMVQTMFDRAGWSPAAFHGFRMAVAYPVCPASLLFRYRLPEGP